MLAKNIDITSLKLISILRLLSKKQVYISQELPKKIVLFEERSAMGHPHPSPGLNGVFSQNVALFKKALEPIQDHQNRFFLMVRESIKSKKKVVIFKQKSCLPPPFLDGALR